ncbi:hypothetical protein M6B38_267890 [Iris pallida]|uniref:Uncharacterized protein n=1 Tax=Iris pallida TaxID=29817 RepID=A0AAX6I9A0_IRIPA|nr:hypothetical protein M6B38_267890 [Iris pallida]
MKKAAVAAISVAATASSVAFSSSTATSSYKEVIINFIFFTFSFLILVVGFCETIISFFASSRCLCLGFEYFRYGEIEERSGEREVRAEIRRSEVHRDARDGAPMKSKREMRMTVFS